MKQRKLHGIKGMGRIAMALALGGAILYLLWENAAFLPGWIDWQETVTADQEVGMSDQEAGYEIRLHRRRVRLCKDGTVLWKSPQDIRVQAALSCDADHDGKEELLLLCWKIGRYGKHRPFWVEKEEKSWTQHLFVYEEKDGEIRPRWMSSYLGQEVAALAAYTPKDGRCRLQLTDREGKRTSWVWESWGFVREDTEVSFCVFGDNLIHEPIYRYGLQNGGSFDFLFEQVRPLVEESDVAVLNQETPLVRDPAQYSDYPRFGTPAAVGEAIADAGFTVVTCATNHMLDRGAAGVTVTKEVFAKRQVLCLGIQTEAETGYRPYEILYKNGIRFALLNYTYGTNGISMPDENPHMVHLLEEAQVREDIRRARKEADMVLVFVHWGREQETQPDAFQKKWTQIFLESRADVVIGTHPHTLQPSEVLTGADGHEMLVYYSIGNFVSAQPEKRCTKGGAARFLVERTAKGCRIVTHALEPLVIVREENSTFLTKIVK